MKLIPKKYKGLGLRLYCNRCKKELTQKCEHNEEHLRYKIVINIPGAGGKRTSKICSSRILEGALAELYKYRLVIEQRKDITLQKGYTLGDGIKRYLDMMFNQGDYVDERVYSEEHKADCTRVLDRFITSLRNSGRNPDRLMLNEIDIQMVRPFYEEVNKHVSSKTSKDRHTRIMRRFLNFLANCGMYSGANIFNTIKTSVITNSPVAVSDKEFQKLLSVISPENGWGIKGTINARKKYYYREWLVDCFLLARHTGLRKRQIYNLSWGDIHDIEGGHKLIVTHNFKVEGIKNESNILSVVPVTQAISDVLERLKNNTNSVLKTEFATVKSFSDFLSRAFTHFYKLAHPNKPHKLYKQLRKAQVTELQALLGDDAYKLFHESGKMVADKHYIDKIVLAKKLLELGR